MRGLFWESLLTQIIVHLGLLWGPVFMETLMQTPEQQPSKRAAQVVKCFTDLVLLRVDPHAAAQRAHGSGPVGRSRFWDV